MVQKVFSDRTLSHKLNSSRVVRLWLALEILLTIISLILLFLIPKAAAGSLLVIFCAIVLTLAVGVLLFIRYSSLSVVKNKRIYLSERTKLLNKVSKTTLELAKIERALATNQANENQEIENSLQKIHKEYIENGLRAAKIEGGNISGVGPKLKEKLKANRIISAADVGTHIQNLDGFGNAKVQALISWKESVLAQLESTKPDKLPDIQLSAIQQKHKRQRDNLTKTRESHQVKQTELSLELETVNRNLSKFKGVTFINYLSEILLGDINNKTLQRGKTAILLSVIGIGAIVHGAFGMISSRALLVASRPTPTLALAPSLTFTAIPTSTNTHAPTPKSTSTITVSHTATLPSTMTRTPTQQINPTALVPLRVHFVDVGQGDAILIQAPGGETGLIDGGETDSGIVQYLQSLGIAHMNLVIATHPHSDHIGGLVQVLNSMPVDMVVTNGVTDTTLTYEHFLDAITASKAEYVEAMRGDTISLGDLNFIVLSPISNTDEDLNNGSLVLRLVYGKVSFLFTGDIQPAAEESMLSSGLDVSATILKIPHHGSRSASPPEFLTAVHPQVAIYSAGLGNDYGFPNTETLAALAAVDAKIYGTDINGTIIVTTDGNGYSIETTKQVQTPTPPIVQPTAEQTPELFINVVSLTSPIAQGGTAKLTINTIPGAICTITVYYKSGASQAAGLGQQTAGGDGNVTWSWKVGSRTTPGMWRIVVTANINGKSISKEIPFEVR